MYGERHALKNRLEELNKAEERTIRHYQEERERIYERLRKLDEDERMFSSPQLLLSETESNSTTETVNEPQTITHEQLVEMMPEVVSRLREDIKKENQSTIEQLTSQLNEAKEIISSLREIQIPEASLNASKEDSEQALHSSPQETTETVKPRRNKGATQTNRNKRTARKNNNVKINTSDQDKVDYAPLYEEALTVLKRHTASVQSIEIKKEVEEKTGVDIPNMTNFMDRLMKKNPQIEKPYRGQYIYRHENDSDNDEANNEVTESVVVSSDSADPVAPQQSVGNEQEKTQENDDSLLES
jgi:hypothetical protein